VLGTAGGLALAEVLQLRRRSVGRPPAPRGRRGSRSPPSSACCWWPARCCRCCGGGRLRVTLARHCWRCSCCTWVTSPISYGCAPRWSASGSVRSCLDSAHRPSRRPGHKETRALLALVVAATALGPLLAVLTGSDVGPLGRSAVPGGRPAAGRPDVPTSAPTRRRMAECAELHTRLRLTGVGPALMAVMPVVLLLVAAEGLRRGPAGGLVGRARAQPRPRRARAGARGQHRAHAGRPAGRARPRNPSAQLAADGAAVAGAARHRRRHRRPAREEFGSGRRTERTGDGFCWSASRSC
jgi:hypothetical protein